MYAYQQEHFQGKTVAALIKNQEIIKICVNENSQHAEELLFRRWNSHLNRFKPRSLVLVVLRFFNNDMAKFANAKPCSECSHCVRKNSSKLSKVIYSIDGGVDSTPPEKCKSEHHSEGKMVNKWSLKRCQARREKFAKKCIKK